MRYVRFGGLYDLNIRRAAPNDGTDTTILPAEASTPAGPISGDASVTLSELTVSSVARFAIVGDLAATLGTVTLESSNFVRGDVAATLGDLIASSTAKITGRQSRVSILGWPTNLGMLVVRRRKR